MIRKTMALDPGEKRIGLAISDESGTLARNLCVIPHVSLLNDCKTILRLAEENQVGRVIVGCSFGDEEEERPQVRHARKIAEKIKELSQLIVELWDESGSTQAARRIRLQSGAGKRARGGHLDDVAAAVILQSWLDAQCEENKQDE